MWQAGLPMSCTMHSPHNSAIKHMITTFRKQNGTKSYFSSSGSSTISNSDVIVSATDDREESSTYSEDDDTDDDGSGWPSQAQGQVIVDVPTSKHRKHDSGKHRKSGFDQTWKRQFTWLEELKRMKWLAWCAGSAKNMASYPEVGVKVGV